MNWFPQIGGGSLAQFPIVRGRKWRTISNQLEGGRRVVAPDSAGGALPWRFSYQDLSDTEAAKLSSFFQACRGRYGKFGFADPTANLIGWSEDLTRPDWQLGSLTAVRGSGDPFGGAGSWQVSNSSAGELRCTQTLGLPGDYMACFSLWVRASIPGSIVLDRDGIRSVCGVSSHWSRAHLGVAGAAGAAYSTFGFSVPSGGVVEVFGMQVEPQPFPSQYKVSGAATGIYPETYFASDEIAITATGSGLWATDIVLLSRT